ncbi:hypothetical protein Acsp03_57800 [Actinomadura sp. NBRC 104412]|nr:hypothetical protein Acsp03_57800 [Actinomadura sp. NBRC 104412]
MAPRSAKADAIVLPMKPAPPVIRTFMTLPLNAWRPLGRWARIGTDRISSRPRAVNGTAAA